MPVGHKSPHLYAEISSLSLEMVIECQADDPTITEEEIIKLKVKLRELKAGQREKMEGDRVSMYGDILSILDGSGKDKLELHQEYNY